MVYFGLLVGEKSVSGRNLSSVHKIHTHLPGSLGFYDDKGCNIVTWALEETFEGQTEFSAGIGQIQRWYAACTDIDDRKRAEERLKEENVARCQRRQRLDRLPRQPQHPVNGEDRHPREAHLEPRAGRQYLPLALRAVGSLSNQHRLRAAGCRVLLEMAWRCDRWRYPPD